MGIKLSDWLERSATRIDLTSRVTHLTKESIIDGLQKSTAEIIFKMLDEEIIVGSNPGSSFIVGSHSAVCFQDAPLYSLAQNILFERNYRKKYGYDNIRYRASGLSFKKQLAFKQGARPVFYDKTEVAKMLLPEDDWWRIVRLDLDNTNDFVDWTHEREWRIKGNFNFRRKDVLVILSTKKEYAKFLDICLDERKPYFREVEGIVIMQSLLI